MTELTTIDGIGPSTADKLITRGIDSVETLALAEWDDIKDIRFADPQWLRDAYHLVMTNESSEPETFVVEDAAPGEAIPLPNRQHAMVAMHGGTVQPMAHLTFYGDDVELLQAVRDTIARKRFDQSTSLEDAVMELVRAAAKGYGIA